MTVPTRIAAGYGLALAALLAIGALCYRSTARLIANEREVAHTHEVLDDLQTILSLLKDAETGQRGYLLTGAKRYLEPYTEARSRVLEVYRDLRTRTRNNPEQQGRLSALKPLIDAKLKELQQTIELRRDRGPEA